jgi:uncharacterized alkaline shock family protein YloU
VALDGITIAPGVVETIAALAAEQTEGVALVCGRPALRRKATAPAVEVALADGRLSCTIHIVAYYGAVLPELGKSVQQAVGDALEGQVGIRPALIDIYIDSILFEG